MKRVFITRAIAGLTLLAVALGAVAFQAKAADAQSPYLSAGGPYAGTVGLPVQFSAASNVGPVTGVYWSFGDGSSDRGFTVLKAYAAPGIYPVSVTVTNIFGQSFTASTTATIGGVTMSTILPSCQTVPAQVDMRGVDPRFFNPAFVARTGTVVCGVTPFSLAPVQLFSPSCYAIWAQYGYIPVWVTGCR